MVAEGTSTKPHRKTRPVLLLGAVLLVSGIVIGAGGAMLLMHNRPARRGYRSFNSSDIAARIAKECGLDEAKTKEVEAVVERNMTDLKAIRQDVSKRMSVVHERLRADLKQVLTPEQYEKWNKHFEKMRKSFGMRRRRGGRHSKHGRPSPKAMIERMDKNGDGRLTKDEVHERFWARLVKSDADGDGAITLEELEASRAKRTSPVATTPTATTTPAGTTPPAGATQ
jgi:EF hand